MECLIVSRATFAEVRRPTPRAILPQPGHSPIRKVRNRSRHSLSLDSLSNLKNDNKMNSTAPHNISSNIPELPDHSKRKKLKKKKRASSHSISPHRVPRETILRNSPKKAVKILPNQFRDSTKPLKQSDTVFCPDTIIKRAISNIASRSATLPHSDTDRLSPYRTTSKFAPSPPVSLHDGNRPIRTSPQKIRTSTFIPKNRLPSGHKFEHPKTLPFPLATHKRRIFFSDPHNPGVPGATSGRIPPLNSPIEVSHSVELVPSLGDVRSQVSLQKELRVLESKRQASARAEMERERSNSEKRAGEEKLRAKAEFRAQIYALNSVMRALEQKKFLEAQSAKV